MYNKKEVLILKIENIKQSINSVSKTIETKSIYPENLQRFFSGIQGDFTAVKKLLSESAEEIMTNVYKMDNYLLIPADKYLKESLEASKLFYLGSKSKSILQFQGTLSLENEGMLYIFAPQNVNEILIRYNKKNITDSAKTDYYRDLKNIIEEGKFDASEILNEEFWYSTKGGDRIFILNPCIEGYTALRDREGVAKQLFDKLFN